MLTFPIYFRPKIIRLFQLFFFIKPLSLLDMFLSLLFPFDHLLVELLRRSSVLFWWFLKLWKLFNELGVLLLFFYFFLLLILFYLFIFFLDNPLVSVLYRLEAAHLLYKFLRLFIYFWMEFKLFSLKFLELFFSSLNLLFSFNCILIKSVQ